MTKDLFQDYDPGPVVARFPDGEVKAYTPSDRLALAVSRVLRESPLSREEIAARMSEITRETVSKAMLDNYAAASKAHTISALRLVALSMVTDDARALNTLLQPAEMIAVPAKYEALMRRERAREIAAKFQREADAASAEWEAKR